MIPEVKQSRQQELFEVIVASARRRRRDGGELRLRGLNRTEAGEPAQWVLQPSDHQVPCFASRRATNSMLLVAWAALTVLDG